MSDLEPGQVLMEVIEKKRIFYGHPLIPLSDHFVTEQQQTVRGNWGFIQLDENDIFLV